MNTDSRFKFQNQKIKKLRILMFLAFIIIGMDFAPIISANPTIQDEDLPRVPITSLNNPTKAYNVLIGASDSELIDDTYTKVEKKFFLEPDDNTQRDFDYSRISDAGNQLKEFNPEGEKVVEIAKIKEIIAERPNSITSEQILNETDYVFVPGLLENTIHQMDPTSVGEVFLDSTLEEYQLNANRIVTKLVTDNQDVKNDGMFNLVVFVSDYKNKGIDKLMENKVWRQVYSRLDSWMKETSDYYVMLVNEYGSPQNIMNLLAEAQLNSNINKIGITFVAHGVTSIYGHGILLHHDRDPKRLGVMDGNILRKALNKTGVQKISKLVYTNIHSCYLIDEYEYYGRNSVLGFFEQQNPYQVLTGYRGLTYLNTKFVLSLENLLAAGTYKFPVTTITTPVTLVDEDDKTLGNVNLIEKTWYQIKTVSESSSEALREELDGDETLFVNDVNHSPADGDSIYFDSSVYEHLGTVPPSFFPTVGDEYSFEGHRSGTWEVINAINDDNTFFLASGKYQGYLEEFGDGFSSENVLSNHWSKTGDAALDNGYLSLSSGSIVETGVTTRPTDIESEIIFVQKDRTDACGDTCELEITLIGDVSSYSVTEDDYNNSSRKFGIKFDQSVVTPSLDFIYFLHNERQKYIREQVMIVDRVYYLSLSIRAGVASLELTTPDDPDFILSYYLTGFSDMENPRLSIDAEDYEVYVDKFEIYPDLSKNSALPSYDVIYEDAPANSISTYNEFVDLDELDDKVSGTQSIKGSEDEIFLAVNSINFDYTNRYLSYAMKCSNDNIQAPIKFKIDIDGQLTTKTLNVSEKSSLRDVVYVNDNKWHTYVYDLYGHFSGMGTVNTIEAVSFQKVGGNVLYDRVYLLSDLSSAIALASSSIETSERIDDSFYNNDILQAQYNFDNNLQDSSGNGYDIETGSNTYFYDFESGMPSGWDVANPDLWSQSSVKKHEGSYSVSIDGTGSSTFDGVLGDVNITDGSIDAWGYSYATNYGATALYIRASNNNGTSPTIKNGYMLRPYVNRFALYSITDGTMSILTPTWYYPGQYLGNAWWHLKLQITGNILEAWISLTSTFTTSPQLYADIRDHATIHNSGYTGFSARSNMGSTYDSYFDDMTITSFGKSYRFYDLEPGMPSGWDEANPSLWSQSTAQKHEGSYSICIDGTGSSIYDGVLSDISLSDGSIEAWAYTYATNYGKTALYIRASDNTGTSPTIKNGYMLLSSVSGFALYSITGGSMSILTPTWYDAGEYLGSKWWHMKLQITGNILEAWISKTSTFTASPQLYADITDHETVHESGYTGLSARSNLGSFYDSYFDEMTVTSFGISSGNTFGYTNGLNGSALDLRNTEDYILNEDGPSTADLITLSSWVKINSFPTTSATIVSQQYNSSSGRGIKINSTGHVIGWSRSSSGVIYSVASSAVITGEWILVSFIQEGDVIELYVDGELEDSEDMGSNLGYQYTTFYTIGKDMVANDYFDGIIDQLEIYKVALERRILDSKFVNESLYRWYEFNYDLNDSVANSDAVFTDGYNHNFVSGKESGSVELIASQYLGMSTILINPGDTATLSIWINPYEMSYYDGSQSQYYLIPIATANTYHYEHEIHWQDDNKMKLRDDSGNNYIGDFLDPYDYLNMWTMITIVFSDLNVKYYANGEYMSSASGLSDSLTLELLGIGYASTIFHGSLDNFKFFSNDLSDEQISDLYWNYEGIQELAMPTNETLVTSDKPTYTFSLDVKDGQINGTKLVETQIEIGSSTFGVKLDNDVWKLDNGTLISDISHGINSSYTITYDISEYTATTTKTKLVILINNGTDTFEVFSDDDIATGYVKPNITSNRGYIISPFISITSNLGTKLYKNSAAEGTWTQGAFALKINRETSLDKVNVKGIEDAYAGITDAGLISLGLDFISYMDTGQVMCYEGYNECSSAGSPASTDPYSTISQSFSWKIDYYYDLDLVNDYKWSDQWFDEIMHYVNTSSYNDSLVSEIKSHEESATEHWFYYNVPLDSNDYQYLTVHVKNPPGKFKLTYLDEFGQVYEEMTGSDYSSQPRTWKFYPIEYQYFYLQLENGADASDLEISFDPTYGFEYASLERISGENESTVLESTYSGIDGYYSSKTPINISYVEYLTDDEGNYEKPIFYPLPKIGEKYYLNKMVAMGGLPIVNSTTKFEDFIDVKRYGKIGGMGQKLINGSTYWETCYGCPTDEKSYELEEADVNDEFTIVKDKSYMFSFDLANRYTDAEAELEIKVYDDTNVAVYYDGTNELSYYDMDTISNYDIYYYKLNLSSYRNSLLLKVESVDLQSDRPLSIKLPGHTGELGYYSLVDEVEEYQKTSLSANDFLTDVIMGIGFNYNTNNEITNAQVPGDARASLESAIETNPTENRVFDVRLLLEKILSDFNNMKSLVKSRVKSILTLKISGFGYSWKDTKVADWVWDKLDKYGFAQVEKIISWFDNEERQENLAKLILQDDDLRGDLKYGTGSLDYLAVAKAGILLFADYIHAKFIDNGPGWLKTTWNTITSKTLVDIVAAIWSVTSTTISAVKNVASDPLGAIKAGLQFIADLVYIAILESLKLIVKNFIQSIGAIVSHSHPTAIVQNINNGITINGSEISIKRKGRTLIFNLGNISLSLSNFLSGIEISYETLGISSDELIIYSAGLQLIGTVAVFGMGEHLNILSVVSTTVFLMSLLGQTILTSKIDDNNRDEMKDYYLGAAVGILVPLLFKSVGAIISNSMVPKAELSFLYRFTKVYPVVAKTYSTFEGITLLINTFIHGKVPTSHFLMGITVGALDYVIGLMKADGIRGEIQLLYDILLLVTFIVASLII